MSDRFQPLTMKQLTSWVFTELKEKNALFGIPAELFFTPKASDCFRTSVYGQPLDTPFGVAAGPHSQMAQNIIAAWLCGGRFIELKTIQTLDELDVSKPCIDMQDEGYNVEWSQELKLEQSFDEYLRAWILIHALHKKLGFPGDTPGIIFNMSVGYNYEGILNDNVQKFLNDMQDAGALMEEYTDLVAEYYPPVKEINIPSKLSNNLTLSTMHGCPPEEIGKIAAYFIEEWGFHTNVKLNPTLLGPERLRYILNDALGFNEIVVPDEAFNHDLKFDDAIKLLTDLLQRAEKKGVVFGVKMSNTLECENHRDVFNPEEKMMYMSGRPLQGVTVNMARLISETFDGKLLMSYAGGADAFNVFNLLACGMSTITVCSDILRSGGYMRMLQYQETTRDAMKLADACDLPSFIKNRCEKSCDDVQACALENLKEYAEHVLIDPQWNQTSYEREKTKTDAPLGLFDCIAAPCSTTCDISQKVPLYMDAVKRGELAAAIDITRMDNPMPTILGRACAHPCEETCVRTQYDQPLAIREMKRYIMDKEAETNASPNDLKKDVTVGVVGGGPCGISLASFLCESGYSVTLFEKREYAGGMVQGTIPAYRATQKSIDHDMKRIKELGVEIRYGQEIGRDLTLAEMKESFSYVVIAAGSQQSMPMGIDGENSEGVLEALSFLREARNGTPATLGSRVGIIGGGDVAMDCARTAKRLTHGDVQVIYRRTRQQMPAEKEEIIGLLEEGIELVELTAPTEIKRQDGKLTALRCTRMKLGEPDDSGRRRPVPIEGSDYDIPLDNLIVAIGQQPDFSFAENIGIDLNRKGYIDIDLETMQTSVPGIYAGGDAVMTGPATIVKACGDGKKIAAHIRKMEESFIPKRRERFTGVDAVDMMRRRAHREFRIEIPELPVNERGGFDEIVCTLSDKNAKIEATRCLECNKYCSLCVTVCPNRAIQTYETEEFELDVPTVKFPGATAEIISTTPFRVYQAFQTLIQTDFCNECANCETFCPTAGAPYRDKPRLYMQVTEFAAEENNAFMLIEQRDGFKGIRAKYNGEVHELIRYHDQTIAYNANGVRIVLDENTFEIRDTAADAILHGSLKMSLIPCAEMFVLLKSLTHSLPYLPVSQL